MNVFIIRIETSVYPKRPISELSITVADSILAAIIADQYITQLGLFDMGLSYTIIDLGPATHDRA